MIKPDSKHPVSSKKNNTVVEMDKLLQTINQFLSFFPPHEVKRISWNLLIYALGSEDTNGLSHSERSNMLYFYEQLNQLCDALAVIDKHAQTHPLSKE